MLRARHRCACPRHPLAVHKSFGRRDMAWILEKNRIAYAPALATTRILRANCESLLSLLCAPFPRSTERGSIEARRLRRVRSRAVARFHVRLSVAPLKLEKWMEDDETWLRFHVRL